MLTKNVYLLYPAGYSGNFINWAICASDFDLRKVTVDSPLNTGSDQKYGGAGTSHLHHRIPTHQNIQQHLAWIILNRPKDFGVYVISTCDQNLDTTINMILGYDPDPVLVVIHDGNDPDIESYGRINCVTKWPVFLSAVYANMGRPLPFDPFACANDINFRNLIARDQVKFLSMSPVDEKQHKNIVAQHHNHLNWFKVRNKFNPHEVNSQYYLDRDYFANNDIFQLSCLDVASEQFIDQLQDILQRSQCSTGFDITDVKKVHQQYIQAQKNLQWFDSIRAWRSTGQLDEYLCSHAMMHGLVIREILADCELVDRDQTVSDDLIWQNFYNTIKDPSWPACDREQDLFDLPQHIQHELIDHFRYKSRFTNDPQRKKCRQELANWKTMTTADISRIYHGHKLNFVTLSKVS